MACISGRSSADARRVVGLDELVYVGEHGLELEPEAAAWSDRLHAFATVDWDDVERKPLTVTFHYRRAENESEALQMLEAVATRARHEGLVPRFGRKVLELRPPVGAHKGTAVAHLLGERGLERALYAGDDTTDLDAFNALQGLELGVAWRSPRRRARRSCARPPTSWSTAPRRCWSCCARSSGLTHPTSGIACSVSASKRWSLPRGIVNFALLAGRDLLLDPELGEERRVVQPQVDELLVAEILDDLDQRIEVGAVHPPFAGSTCSGRNPASIPAEPAPSINPAGTRFIEGEPMKRATKTFVGRV